MSIEERKLWSVSPSACTQYLACARTWWYGYVKGVRGPTPPHMAKGTSIHAGLEHYLKTGEVLISHRNRDSEETWQVMEFIQAAIPFLPKPITDSWWKEQPGNAGLMLEQDGSIGTYEDGPSMNQYIDMIEAHDDWAMITDYKTLSDKKYAKSPEELSVNTQLICNAKFLFSISDYKVITLRHLYLLTSGKRPKAFESKVEVTRGHVDAEFDKILVHVRAMCQWFKLNPDTADPLPPNTDHCSAYGGCQYRPKCFGTNELFTIKSRMSEGDKMSLLDRMVKKAGQEPAIGTVVPVMGPNLIGTTGPLGVVAPIPAQAKPLTLLSKAKALEPTLEALTPESAQAAAVAAGYPVEAPKPYVGIVPPDAPSPISTPEEVAEESGEFTVIKQGLNEAIAYSQGDTEGFVTHEAPTERTKRKRRTKSEMEQARKAELTAEVTENCPDCNSDPKSKQHQWECLEKPAEAEGEVVLVEAPIDPELVKEAAAVVEEVLTATKSELRKWSDLKKDHPIPAERQAAIDVKVSEAVAEIDAAEAKEDIKEETESQKIYKILNTPDPVFTCGLRVLFIDCMPGKGWGEQTPEDLLNFLHAFNRLASDTAGVADYRMIRYESKAYLATAMRLYMRGLPPVMYVDSRTPGADTFMETVIPYCQMVFRGVR